MGDQEFAIKNVDNGIDERYLALLEKMIVIGKGGNYGNIVFMAGGAGSGKGFAVSKFLDGNKFKVRDVDEWKRIYMKIGKVKDKYPELKGLDLRKPQDVAKLHIFVDKLGIKDKTLSLMLSELKQGKQPNIIFDVTAKDPASIINTAKLLVESGYDPKKINVVWVLANFEVAFERNANRARVVPSEIFKATHVGAAKTMSKILFDGALDKSVDGEAFVILNNSEETKFYTGTKVVKDFTYMKVKEVGKKVKVEGEAKQTLMDWVEVNTPKVDEAKFSASKISSLHEITRIKINSRLLLIVSDSDPYDVILYQLDNKFVASEYVADYKKRVKEIKGKSRRTY